MQEYVVQMKSITKRFPGILANDGVNLDLKKGEIHAILGENGAGKSTLMSVLFGLYEPDEGEVYIGGKKVTKFSPSIAFSMGIGMVHQHFKLIDNFTVTQNIILGQEPTKGLVVDEKKAAQKVKELSELYGLNIDPYAKIEDISVGMQQRVEILKVLYRSANIIVLDEPTAVLTPQEIEELFLIIKNFIREGKSVFIITHKLKEIMAIADRCSVLRRGKYIGTVDIKDTNEEELARMMVGRNVNFKVHKEDREPGKEILRIEDLWVKDNRGIDTVKGLNLSIREGEILGLAGIDGNGQQELIEALTGLRKIEKGKIYLNGKEINDFCVKKRITHGLSHIPEDRQKRGLVLDFFLSENLILHKYKSSLFQKRGNIKFNKIKEYSDRLIEEFDVRSANGSKSIVRTMSGGNQQKAIIAREIDMNPDIMVAAQPTRGLDVGAIEYIHSRLVDLRNQNKAVLLVSFELDEILAVSDKIAVIFDGRIMGEVLPKNTTENELGLMMSGSKEC